MTDLPTLKKPVPLVPQDDEEWRLRMVSQDDPNDQHPATLEDVSAVLDAAGYKIVRTPRCEFVLDETVDEDEFVRCGEPAVFRRWYSCKDHVHAISPLSAVLIGKLEYDVPPMKTSGSTDGWPGFRFSASASRQAEGRKEPGTIQFKSKEEMLDWFRAVSEAINRADGEIIGAAKLHEHISDLTVKVVALEAIARDAIKLAALGSYKVDHLQEKLDVLK